MNIIRFTADNWQERLTPDAVRREMQVKPGDDSYDEYIDQMLAEAKAIGMPKLAVKECAVTKIADDMIEIDAMPLRSKLVIEKLSEARRVYAYVITCGRELDDWAMQYASDPLLEFITSSIMKACIPFGFELLQDHLKNEGIEKYATLNPGSLPSWPITGQRQVFGLLSGSEREYATSYMREFLGVELTESSLMVPLKSVSGLAFESDVDWHNCSRCSKKDCPNRRAPMSDEAEQMISTAGAVEKIVI